MSNTDDLNRTLFISDNLPFLESLDTESVDLVVIDPPFGKNQTFEGTLHPPLTDEELGHEYDLLSRWGIQNEDDAYDAGVEFPDQDGKTAKFRDIWDFKYQVTEEQWDRIGTLCRPALHLIEATRYTHSKSTAAYIAFMTLRMIEIRRVLKKTGSVYLHCDHEANAYLRQMMDAVFWQQNFRNEIVWRRTYAHNDPRQFGRITESMLFYSKSAEYTWNTQFAPYSDEYLDKFFRYSDERGRFRLVTLTGPGTSRGDSGGRWRGYSPSDSGRTWSVPRRIVEQIAGKDGLKLSINERLDLLEANGYIYWPPSGSVPSFKEYLDEMPGTPIQNLWTDINPLSRQDKERTGYPTQKPQALARRIIEASSNPGDLVLDCFAGCAYVPVAAELTGRHWIACDMSPRAWTVVRRQFHKQPDLRIVTEGEYLESSPGTQHGGKRAGMQPDLGDERIIKVRGPSELPEGTTPDERQKAASTRELPAIEFRQRPREDSQTIWEAFVNHWGAECWYCGQEKQRDRRELQLDHIEPNKRDGSNDDCWNRALACVACNSDKGDKRTVRQTIDMALQAGRIETEARRDAQVGTFESLHQWAKERWEETRE